MDVADEGAAATWMEYDRSVRANVKAASPGCTGPRERPAAVAAAKVLARRGDGAAFAAGLERPTAVASARPFDRRSQ